MARGRVLAQHAKYAISLFLLGVALYARSLSAPFFFDDTSFVRDNPAVKSLGAAFRTFGEPSAVAATAALQRHTFRPLLPVFYALQTAIFGAGPFGYHLTVVLLHALNGVLFYFVFLRLGAGREWAWFGAALFVAHPVNVESPAWISGLDDISWVTFFLPAVLVYLRWRDTGGAWRLVAALALYAVSLLLKETASSMAATWLLLEFVQPAQRKGARVAAALFFVPALLYVGWRVHAVGGVTQLDHYLAGSLKNTLLTTAVIFADYLRLLFLPVNLMLEYNPTFRQSIFDPWVVGSALLLFGVVLHFGVRRWKTPAWFFFCLALCSLAPAANLLPINSLQNERFLYFATGSFGFLAATALGRAAAQRPRARFAGHFVLAMFCILTLARVEIWRSPIALWADVVAKNPDSVIGHRNFGVELLWRGDLERAETEFRRELACDGGRSQSYQSLAYVHLLLRQCAEAAREFALYLADNPGDPATLEQYRQALACAGTPPP
jgi:hypothetical protein